MGTTQDDAGSGPMTGYPCPEDHEVLDGIMSQADNHSVFRQRVITAVHRESECIEFYDATSRQWYEIVVRPIDEPSTPTESMKLGYSRGVASH